METSSLATLKKEIQTLPHPTLVDLLVRLGKYKKENKELLHYLLFEAHDEQAYIKTIKAEVEELFVSVNPSVHLGKKTVRKILRGINKQIKYSGKPETAVELLIHFLQQFRSLPGAYFRSTVMMNLYEAQLKRIDKEMQKLHEDIQYDYRKEIESL